MASYTNPFGMSPYRMGGVPTMASMNAAGGFTTVSPETMALARLGKQPRTQFGNVMRGQARLNMLGDETNPDDDVAKAMGYGEDRQSGGKMDAIRRLLSGERGAAIGGLAQGAGSVIGSYLQSRPDRERLKMEKEAMAARSKENERIRALLDPMLQEQMDRARRYQEQMDRQYGVSR